MPVRLMVGRWTLTPEIDVRVVAGHPSACLCFAMVLAVGVEPTSSETQSDVLATELSQRTHCVMDWSACLDLNQRPPASKAGALRGLSYTQPAERPRDCSRRRSACLTWMSRSRDQAGEARSHGDAYGESARRKQGDFVLRVRRAAKRRRRGA
jgi:hypothetical protein